MHYNSEIQFDESIFWGVDLTLHRHTPVVGGSDRWVDRYYNNNQWCSVVYRVLDQRRLL